jgi:hypothetical protein
MAIEKDTARSSVHVLNSAVEMGMTLLMVTQLALW